MEQPHLNNHNRISTTTTASQQPRHPHHSATHDISSPSPQQHLHKRITSPNLHLHCAAIFSPATAIPNERHLRDRCGDSLVGARADDFYNVRVVRMIPTTSAHVRISRRVRIKMPKGAEPAGGRRSEVEDQTRLPDPIKRRAECQASASRCESRWELSLSAVCPEIHR